MVVENAKNATLTLFATSARLTESTRGAATAVAPVATSSADIASAAVAVRTLDRLARLLFIPLSQFVIGLPDEFRVRAYIGRYSAFDTP